MSKSSPQMTSRRVLGSASSAALAIMLSTAGSAFAQTVTSQTDGETITLAAPVTVADNPVVVVANNDVIVENNADISTTGITQTVQVNAMTSGAVINNTLGNTISADSRAINIDGTDATINNFGSILGTGDQRNGTIYGNRTSNNLTINNNAGGIIDAGMGNNGAGIAIEVGGGGAPITGSITNAGLIQGRGQAPATGGTAGDGLRFFGPGLAPVYQYNGDITNSGTITSESAVGPTAGVRFANQINFGGTLNNESLAVISGVNNGLYFGEADHTGGVVNNAGTISSDSRAVNIDGTGLTLNNSGSIVGTGAQRNGTLYADGTATNFIVDNTGTIDAVVEGSGFAAEIQEAGNAFAFFNNGIIRGRGDVVNADGFRVGNPGNSGTATVNIVNTGEITSESNQGTTAGLRFVDNVAFAGAIENTGIISGVRNGVYFGDAAHTGTFTNTVGGLISSDSRAFNIDGTGLTLNNTGTIIGTGAQRNGTVYADGTATNFTVNNTGTIDAGIEGSGFAAEIQAEGNTFTLINSGEIDGVGDVENADGVRIGNVGNVGIATVSILNSGEILSASNQGTTAGLRFVDNVAFAGTIENTGTIAGVRNGVYFGNAAHTGSFTNAASGLITSNSRAFNIDGSGLTLNNAGNIIGNAAQRNGTLYADGTATDFTVNNTGTIDAVVSGSGFAAEIGGVEGGNTFAFTNSGLIAGRGQGDAATGAAGDGFRIGNVGNTGLANVNITNSGTISSDSLVGTTAGLRIVNGISAAGTITNSGTITGAQNGLYLGNATDAGAADFSDLVITNTASGTISSGSRAVNIDGTGATLINEGDILGTAAQRNGTVYADGTATDFTVTNSGTIDAVVSGSGFAAEIGSDGNAFTIDNSGLIAGRGQGDAATGAAGDGVRIGNVGNAGLATIDITNSGTISSDSLVGTTAGLRIVNGISAAGTITNTETGVISGVQNGLYLGNDTPAGAADFSELVIDNAGTISSGSRAVNIDGTGVTLNNTGVILGTGNQRNGTVYADGTATDFTVNNSGTIDAGEGLDGSGFAAEIDGENSFTFDNSGDIQGRGQGAFSDGFRIGNGGNTGVAIATITNSGTINSESTGAGAVSGFRIVNGVALNGTLTNTETGVISGAQNGVYFGTGDHSNAVVDNAGLISSDSRAFNIDGSGLTLNNTGDILGTGVQRNGTLYADGTATDFTVNNSGTIDAVVEGSGFAAEIDAMGNAFTFDNSGDILGRGDVENADGFRVGNPGNIGTATVNITNSGLIASESNQGTTAGLRFVNGIDFAGTIENSGTISGVRNGVYFGNPVAGEGADHSNGIFTNTETGIISSDSRAFNIDGLGLTLNNAGSILGTGDQRNGTLYADGTATDFTVNNSGTIDAGEGNIGSAFAAEIASTGNAFTFDNSGTLQGRGQGDAATGAAGDGFRIGNVGNSGLATIDITNSGTIASESAVGTTAGLRIVNGISATGTITNTESGVISGVQNGLYLGNATPAGGGDFSGLVIDNAGTISSGSRAFNIDGTGVTVNNSGSILGTGNQRNGTLYADGTATDFTVNNSGTIDAGEGNIGSGFAAEIASTGNTFTFDNSGAILGRGQGDAATGAAGDGFRIGNVGNSGLATIDITNSGTIASESAVGTTAGLRIVNGISAVGTIDNFGTISGVQNGLYFGNATPAGGADFTGLVVNNAGTISSGSRALNIDGLGLTVNNSGLITGTGDQRNGTVYADATADQYTLNNTGTIDAGAGNNGSGVSLQSGDVDGETVSFTVVNDGTIAGRGTELTPAGVRIFAGAADVTVDGTLTNSGTISSDNSAAILIQDVDFVGTITNSGTLIGTSVLDASTATGGVTFNQIGGTFDSNFIGSDFDDVLTISGPNFGLNADILGGVETTITAGTTTVSGNRSLEGNLTSNGNLTFDLGVDSLAVDGNTTFAAGSTVTVTTNTDVSDILLNAPITVISDTGTTTDNGLSVNVIDDDFLVDYSVELDAVIVTATAADLSNVSNDANVSALSTVIGASFAAGQLDRTAATTFNSVSNAGEFEANVVSLLPSINEGVSREIWETHSQTATYVEGRLTGEAPGGAWVQGQARSADRDAESLSVEGYGADTTAVTFGYDRKVSDALRLGASYTFANIDIDEEVNAGESNDLSTNQIAAYVGYDAGDVKVTGQVGYVFGDGESQRVTDLGTVSGDYDVSGFTAQATAAYDLGLIKPQAGLRYGTVSQDAFTEAGGLNLNVDAETVTYFEGVIGATVAPEFTAFGDWSLKPVLGANYVLDFVGDAREVNVTLPGGSPVLLSSGDAAGSRFEIAAGLDLANVSGVSVGVSYQGDFASGYTSNAGLLRARVNF